MGHSDVTTLLTVAAVVLGVLLTLAAALGVYAAYRTARSGAVLAQYRDLAETAKQSADVWQGRQEATQAELDALTKKTAEDKRVNEEAQRLAQAEIITLKEKVATLEGVVTARNEIAALTAALAAFAETVHHEHAAMLAKLDTIAGKP